MVRSAVLFEAVSVTETVVPPATVVAPPVAPPTMVRVSETVTAPVGLVVAPIAVTVAPVPPVAVRDTDVPPSIVRLFPAREVTVELIAPVAPLMVNAPATFEVVTPSPPVTVMAPEVPVAVTAVVVAAVTLTAPVPLSDTLKAVSPV